MGEQNLRARTRPQHGSETPGTTRTSRDPPRRVVLRQATADIPLAAKKREREGERKNHPRNEAASIVGISRVSKQVSLEGARAWQLTLHLCLGSEGSKNGGFERDPSSKEKEYGTDGGGNRDEKREWEKKRKDRVEL